MPAVATEDFDAMTDGNQLNVSADWVVTYEYLIVEKPSADGRARGHVNDEACEHWTSDSFDDNQYAELVLKNTSGYHGPAVRCASGAATYYGYYGGSGDSYLFKMVAGSWTQLGNTGAAIGIDSVMYLEADGTTITPKDDGSIPDPPGAQTDSAIASGNAGICAYGAGDSSNGNVDTWEGGNLAAEPPATEGPYYTGRAMQRHPVGSGVAEGVGRGN